MLTLRLFGPPALSDEAGQALPLQRKTLVLLALLAIERRPLTRAWLADRLWPASDDAHARGTLRRVLLNLRAALGAHAAAIPMVAETVALDPQQIDCDLVRLSAVITATLQDPTARAAAMAAFSRYGGPFLADIQFPQDAELEGWIHGQRAYWEGVANSLAEALVGAWLEAGQTGGAVQVAMHWMAVCPQEEAAYRAAMRSFWLAGDQHRAQDAWIRCQQVLQERGEEPSAATREVAAHLTETPKAPAPPPPLALPLVGRAHILGALRTQWRATQAGDCRTVVISGIAGIGKTRVTQEFARWVALAGGQVLWGHAYDLGGRLPFQPLIEALRPRLEAERAPDDLLADTWLTELSRILPDLRDRYPDLPLPDHDPQAQGRLFEAVAQLGMQLAARQPVVLVVEDIQWADLATRDLLLFLQRRWQGAATPILLIVTVRAEEPPLDAALRHWLSQVTAPVETRHLRLEELTEATTHELVQQLFGNSPVDTFAAWLHAETGGHPLYIRQMVRLLAEQGFVQQAAEHLTLAGGDDAWHQLTGTIPDSLRDIILARLERVEDAIQQIMMTAALLGLRIAAEEVAAVAQLPLDVVVAALDRAVDQYLVSAEGTAYRFTHEKVREVIAAHMSPARRDYVHRQAYATLLARAAPPERLAYHAMASQQQQAAFTHYVQAGDAAMALYAAADACQHYGAAAALYEVGIGMPPSAGEHLWLHLARAYEATHQWERAKAAHLTLSEDAALHGEPDVAVAARISLANLLAQLNQVHRAAEELGTALTLARAAHLPQAEGEALWHLAYLHAYHLDPLEGLRLGEEAAAIGRNLGDAEIIAGADSAIGLAAQAAGQFERGATALTAAVARYRELAERSHTSTHLPRAFWAPEAPTTYLGYRTLQAQCLIAVMISQVNLGDPLAGRRLCPDVMALVAETRSDWVRTLAGVNRNHVLLDLADYPLALQVTTEALDVARTMEGAIHRQFLLAVLGRLYYQVGMWDAAKGTLEESYDLAREQFPRWVTVVLPSLAAVAAQMGQWDRAWHYAQEAGEARRNLPGLVWQDFARWYETEALLRAGDEAAARDDIAHFRALVGPHRRHRLVLRRMEAVLAAHQGDSVGADLALTEAQGLAEAMGLPGERWRILGERAALAERVGAPERARPLRETAWATVTPLIQALGEGIEQQSLRHYAIGVLGPPGPHVVPA